MIAKANNKEAFSASPRTFFRVTQTTLISSFVVILGWNSIWHLFLVSRSPSPHPSSFFRLKWPSRSLSCHYTTKTSFYLEKSISRIALLSGSSRAFLLLSIGISSSPILFARVAFFLAILPEHIFVCCLRLQPKEWVKGIWEKRERNPQHRASIPGVQRYFSASSMPLFFRLLCGTPEVPLIIFPTRHSNPEKESLEVIFALAFGRCRAIYSRANLFKSLVMHFSSN